MNKITIDSTTDTPEDVTAAMGGLDSQSEQESTAVAQENEAETSEESAPLQSEDEQQSVDGEDLEESEEDSEDDSEDDEEQEQAQQKPKRKNGFKRRIDKLNKKIEAKDLELEYWKKQAMSQSNQEQQQEPQEESPRIEQNAKPDPDQFESQDEYIEALTDWKLEQKLSAQKQEQEKKELKSEYEQIVSSHKQRVNQYAEQNPTFMDDLEELSDYPVSKTVQQMIMESENGPAIMHHFTRHPEHLEKVNKMGVVGAAKEFGRIEATIGTSKPSQKQEVKKSNAPRPLKPVKTKAESKKNPDEMSFQEYKAWRAKKA